MFDNIMVFNNFEQIILLNMSSLKLLRISLDEYNFIKIKLSENNISHLPEYVINFLKLDEEEFRIKEEIEQSTINFGIIISYKCNYNCTYCYESKDKSNKHIFTRESLVAIDSFYSEYCSHFNIQKNYGTIYIQGGEPFLPENYKILNEIFEYWKNCRFIITTNGTYIEFYKNLILKYNIALKISIDGIKDVHFKYRKAKDKSFYDNMIHGLKWAISENIPVTILSVFHPKEVDKYSEFFDLLEKCNARIGENIKLHFINEFGCGFDDVRNEYLLECNEAFADLIMKDNRANLVSKSGFLPGATNLLGEIRAVQLGKCKNPFRCSWLWNKNYTFLPSGEVIGCLMDASKTEIGKFYPNTVIDYDKLKFIKKRNVKDMIECKECIYKWACKGGCPVTASKSNKDILSKNCGIWNNKEILKYLDNILF